MKVYFDKNVLSHIICVQRGDKETHGVTLEDVSELIDAVSEGKIISLLSTMHLQEAAYVLRAASRELWRRLAIKVLFGNHHSGRVLDDI